LRADVQPAGTGNLQKIERMYVPEKIKNTEYLEGTASEIAKKLVDKLRNEVHVL
jgi:electron transfer flavoprotein alpha/beta subunit